MNNHLKEAIEKFMVSEPIADLGIVQCTLLQHRLEQFCDYMESHGLNVEKKIIGRCVHDHKPITCTGVGQCSQNNQLGVYHRRRKVEGEKNQVGGRTMNKDLLREHLLRCRRLDNSDGRLIAETLALESELPRYLRFDPNEEEDSE